MRPAAGRSGGQGGSPRAPTADAREGLRHAAAPARGASAERPPLAREASAARRIARAGAGFEAPREALGAAAEGAGRLRWSAPRQDGLQGPAPAAGHGPGTSRRGGRQGAARGAQGGRSARCGEELMTQSESRVRAWRPGRGPEATLPGPAAYELPRRLMLFGEDPDEEQPLPRSRTPGGGGAGGPRGVGEGGAEQELPPPPGSLQERGPLARTSPTDPLPGPALAGAAGPQRASEGAWCTPSGRGSPCAGRPGHEELAGSGENSLAVYDAIDRLAEADLTVVDLVDLCSHMKDAFATGGLEAGRVDFLTEERLQGALARAELEASIQEALEISDDAIGIGVGHQTTSERAEAAEQHLKLEARVRKILRAIDSLNWEQVAFEFGVILRRSQEGNKAVSDLEDFYWEHYGQGHKMLSASRLAMEDTLSKHKLKACEELGRFLEKILDGMKVESGTLSKFQSQLELLRHGKEKTQSSLATNANIAQASIELEERLVKAQLTGAKSLMASQPQPTSKITLAQTPGPQGNASDSSDDGPDSEQCVATDNQGEAPEQLAQTHEEKRKKKHLELVTSLTVSTTRRGEECVHLLEQANDSIAVAAKELERSLRRNDWDEKGEDRRKQAKLRFEAQQALLAERAMICGRLNSVRMPVHEDMFTCGSLSTAGMAASADLLSVAKKAANFRNRLASKQAEGQRRELLDKERSHEDQLREVCRRCRRVGQQVAMEFGDELWTVGGEDPCTVHFNRNPREFVLPAVKTLTGLVVSEADTGSDIERAVDLKTSLRAVENCLVEEARERIANREKGKSYESLQRTNKTAMAFDGLVRELASLLGQPADATPEAPQPAAEALGHEPPEVPGAGTQRSAARASLARSSEPPEVRRAGTRRSGARSSVARSSLARSSLGHEPPEVPRAGTRRSGARSSVARSSIGGPGTGESSLFEVFGEEDSEAESGLEGEARALLPGVGAQKASGSASPSAAASTWGSGRVEAEELSPLVHALASPLLQKALFDTRAKAKAGARDLELMVSATGRLDREVSERARFASRCEELEQLRGEVRAKTELLARQRRRALEAQELPEAERAPELLRVLEGVRDGVAAAGAEMAERLLRVAPGAPPSGGKSAARRRSALRPAGRRPSQQAGSRRASAGEAEERAAEIRRLRLVEAQAEAAQHNVEKMLDLQTNVNKVLRRRAERSREDLSKMYARLAKLTGRKGLKDVDPAAQLEQRLASFKSYIATYNRTLFFWRQRFVRWFANVRQAYGNEVGDVIEDPECPESLRDSKELWRALQARASTNLHTESGKVDIMRTFAESLAKLADSDPSKKESRGLLQEALAVLGDLREHGSLEAEEIRRESRCLWASMERDLGTGPRRSHGRRGSVGSARSIEQRLAVVLTGLDAGAGPRERQLLAWLRSALRLPGARRGPEPGPLDADLLSLDSEELADRLEEERQAKKFSFGLLSDRLLARGALLRKPVFEKAEETFDEGLRRLARLHRAVQRRKERLAGNRAKEGLDVAQGSRLRMLSLFREDMQRIDTLRSLGRDPRTAGSARASSRSLPEAGALHDPAEGPTPQSQGQAGRRGQGATGSGGAAGAPRGQVSRGQAADPLPRLLQGLRAKLLSAFGGLGKAYQLFAHAEGVLTRPSFERLCEVVGFGREAAGAMFPFIVALRSGSAGREVAGEPHISSVDFVRALRWSRPVAELSSLRQRLKVRFGGLREAFAEGTGGDKEMTWPQFRALVERTCVDPTSAQSLFWQILRHGRYTRLACREPTATRADFLRALRHAEGLSAAARLRARLREARARCGRPPPEHLEAMPADAGDRAEQSKRRMREDMEEICQMFPRKLRSRPLQREELQAVLEPLQLPAGDASALFRAAASAGHHGAPFAWDVAAFALGGWRALRRLVRPADPDPDEQFVSLAASGEEADVSAGESDALAACSVEGSREDGPQHPAEAPSAAVLQQRLLRSSAAAAPVAARPTGAARSFRAPPPSPSRSRDALQRGDAAAAAAGPPPVLLPIRASTARRPCIPEAAAAGGPAPGQDLQEGRAAPRRAGSLRWASQEARPSSPDGRGPSPEGGQQLRAAPALGGSGNPLASGAAPPAADAPAAPPGETQEAGHARRVGLFGGDAAELEIAVQRTHEFRVRLLSRFRTARVALSKLGAGGRGATDAEAGGELVVPWADLPERIEKVLSFNRPDAARVTEVLRNMGSTEGLDLASLLTALRFAAPTASLLEFGKRLVQRYQSVEAGLRVLGPGSGVDLGQFEQMCTREGIARTDALRLFRSADAAQPGGARGHLSGGGIRFALEHSHVLSWLEPFAGALVALGPAALGPGEPEGRALRGPADLRELLAPAGFPAELAPPTFAFLREHAAPGGVAAGSLARLARAAFGEGQAQAWAPQRFVHCGDEGSLDDASSRSQEALAHCSRLRLWAQSRFGSYEAAFRAIAGSSSDGVPLEAWMERCGETGLSADAWELVFGHCIRWQHPRWDHQLRGPAPRISAAAFAAALEDAAPCRTLAQLRRRLERRHGPPRRAWGALAGREGLEEVRLPRWRLAMQHIGIPAADAGELWALLQASVPGAVQGGCRGVARGTFLAAMQHADALTRLLELLQRVCRAPSGLTAAAPFALEGLDYARWPLGQEEFARELARLLRVGAEDAGLLFALLDVHGEGAVLVDDLLDALTSMQGAYLPRAAEPLDRSSSRAAPPEREAAAQHPQQASPEAVVAGRPQAPASTTPSRGLCTPTPLAASQCTSPDQVDPRNFVRASNTPRKGRPGTSLNLAIASTALPEDSDDSDEGSADRRRALAGGAPPQRPWTSMSGAAARRPAARREAGTTLRGALGGPGPERPQGVGGLAAGRCSVGAGGALSARASVPSVPLQPQGAAQRPWPASSARGASKDAAAHLPHLDQARQPEAARAASAGRGERGAAAWTARAASARRGSPPRAGLGARRHAGAAGAGRRPASGEGPRRQRQGELGLAVIGGGRAARPAVGG